MQHAACSMRSILKHNTIRNMQHTTCPFLSRMCRDELAFDEAARSPLHAQLAITVLPSRSRHLDRLMRRRGREFCKL